jgi:hypothetical protein
MGWGGAERREYGGGAIEAPTVIWRVLRKRGEASERYWMRGDAESEVGSFEWRVEFEEGPS